MAGLTARILTHIWGQRSGYVFLPRKRGKQWIERSGIYVWPNDLTGITVPADEDVYFCPLVFSTYERKAQYALPTACLWSDLDLADPTKIKMRPSVAWKTTQGGFGCETHINDVEEPAHWQALWLLDREVMPDVAAELSRRIAYAEGADKGGWDVTQVLRLPGTYNHKHLPPQHIEVLWAELRLYDPRQIALMYPKVEIAAVSGGVVEWPNIEQSVIDQHRSSLPVGVQYMLERDAGGADRSVELLKMARNLLKFGVPRDVAVHLLDGSAMALSKFAGRTDAHKVLLQTISDAATVKSPLSK